MADRKIGIFVEEVCRVEGHGNIVLNATNGQIEELRLEITESPRFYEAMMLGRRWDEATHISCRICGICSIAHTTASVHAIEDAFGIQPSEQTVALRKIAYHGEMFQSHVLHYYYLAAPDFLGVPSVFPLIQTHPEEVKRALRLKRLGNDLCRLAVGRHLHPQAYIPGTVTKIPPREELEAIHQRCVDARADVDAAVELFATLELPDFQRPCEGLASWQSDEYGMYKAEKIKSTMGDMTDVHDYLSKIHEFVVPHSHAKHAKTEHGAYMVGALARYRNNAEQLHPRAKAAAEHLSMGSLLDNPFAITVAQVVESVHSLEEAIKWVEWCLEHELEHEDWSVKPRAGRGVGITEAPRGLLIHDYTFDDDGKLLNVNCIIPTNQNLNNIEHDFRALVPKIIDRPDDEIRLLLEMLVRAYDPCISCATHLLHVHIKRE
ncbi:MAG: Ni/Fe hydrogenase subunit alpha [Armatimonadetes bacterium]|nr:Ni/Fe hydrogenase subunit alpha [Armatimonadota bacterium]